MLTWQILMYDFVGVVSCDMQIKQLQLIFLWQTEVNMYINNEFGFKDLSKG